MKRRKAGNYKEHLMQSLAKSFELYSFCNRKPQKGCKQRNSMIPFMFKENSLL